MPAKRHFGPIWAVSRAEIWSLLARSRARIYFNVCEKIFVVPINMPAVADLFDNEDAAKDFAQI